jgi:hypothetical protein
VFHNACWRYTENAKNAKPRIFFADLIELGLLPVQYLIHVATVTQLMGAFLRPGDWVRKDIKELKKVIWNTLDKANSKKVQNRFFPPFAVALLSMQIKVESVTIPTRIAIGKGWKVPEGENEESLIERIIEKTSRKFLAKTLGPLKRVMIVRYKESQN